MGREALENEIEVERVIKKKKHLVEKIRKFGPCSKASKIVGLVTTASYKKKKKNKKKNLPEIITTEIKPLIMAISGVSVFSQVFQFQSSQFLFHFFQS